MKKFRVLVTAVAAAAFLAGCGGSTDAGDQAPRVAFKRMVNFGDSLSDVGTYRTRIVGASGGGYYSINGDLTDAGLLHTNWTEFLAAQLQVPQPCAAQVGLDSGGPLVFLNQPRALVAGCTSYAEGGARVTNPVGPGNIALTQPPLNATSGYLGQLTVPVAAQLTLFLGADGSTRFLDTDLVTVMAGGNDLFIDRAVLVDGGVQAAGAKLGAGLIDQAGFAAAVAAAAQAGVDAMSQAGTELAALINTRIVANGATHVVVVNLPDVSLTPDNATWKAGASGTVVEQIHPHLTLDMTNAFNAALAAGLQIAGDASPSAAITWVDAFTESDKQAGAPFAYGLTNVTTPACDLARTGVTLPAPVGLVPLASSLFCTKASLIAVDAANVTATDPTGVLHYEFADAVHPTPYSYRLLAELVGLKLAAKGWL